MAICGVFGEAVLRWQRARHHQVPARATLETFVEIELNEGPGVTATSRSGVTAQALP
jgi:hypothetical protein